MTRYPNWPKLLADFVEEKRNDPFQYGKNDCWLFAAGAARAIAGEDLAADVRGRYKTARGAKRLLNSLGGMRALVANLPEKQPGLAQRGDIVLAKIDKSEIFGVVVGGGFWAAPGPDGLAFRSMADGEVLTAFGV